MDIEPGKVYVNEAGTPQPLKSTLADAFFAKDDLLAEAVVLRGYLGRSPILQRATQYLQTAKEAKVQAGEDTAGLDGLLAGLAAVAEGAEPHVPWRIYLTARLNRYVDFHLSALLAWRQEPKTERRDTCTVWLRGYTPQRVPWSYRIVEETVIGPTFATYLGGDLVDDYLGQPGASDSAWAGTSSLYAGGKIGTTPRCAE
jgi:hypothetical protein